jgi:hypothetical protein
MEGVTAMARGISKKPSVKKFKAQVCKSNSWTIVEGELKRSPGHPGKTESLFKVVGEKIPFEFLNAVEKNLKSNGITPTGVYIAHDSMGYPRYIGRGNIFNRLDARRKAQVLELSYFSFFVMKEKVPVHVREVETIMIRAAGPLLDFNNRKIRIDVQAGDVRDFEAGTKYIERQYKRGRAKSKKKAT